jgi:alkanesulfonate monooxygenase SsuD/methylene tetrahydromethanopterin reductase-like flavin-dependent oxidoreductase (luciferase family)
MTSQEHGGPVSRRPLLGVTLPQFTDDADRLLDAALSAEEAGLDSVWVFDHMWPLSGGKKRPVLECWSALAYVAAATSRIGVGTLVTRSTLRHPAVLAKMVSTVASVAPGRLTVTVGSGDSASRAENEAFGLPYFAGDARAGQLESTVRFLTRAVRGGSVSQHDSFVDVRELWNRPAEPVPVWTAGRSRKMLEIAGRYADGYNAWGSTPANLRTEFDLVRAAAGGRRVKMTWAGLVLLGDTEVQAKAKLRYGDPSAHVAGSAEKVAVQLKARAEAGAKHLIATLPDAGPRAYEQLALEVAPLVRG